MRAGGHRHRLGLGLGFSTVLTLFFIPSLYLGFTHPPLSALQRLPLLPLLIEEEPKAWRHWMARLSGSYSRETFVASSIQEPERRQRHKQAVEAIDGGHLERAIRDLQWLADHDTRSMLFSLYVVQALLLYVHQNG